LAGAAPKAAATAAASTAGNNLFERLLIHNSNARDH